MLKIGDTAPDFELEDQAGNTIRLSTELKEGDVLLYFYPADFSPVCTAEACTFRDSYDEVAEINTRIIGVSPQSVSSHERFARAFSIPFPLLSDDQRKVIRAYGAVGPLGLGVRRVTYLIGQDGVIVNRVASELMVGSHAALLRQTIAAAAS